MSLKNAAMVYKIIGLMSGRSLNGLDIAFVQLQETSGKWSYEILHTDRLVYDDSWREALDGAAALSAKDYLLLHNRYGAFLGNAVNQFIDTHQLHHQVHLVASHGYTVMHSATEQLSVQLGSGAVIAATTQLPVVSDLRAMDMAFGGKGTPIIAIGEKLLWGEYNQFLNIGALANLSVHSPEGHTSVEVCPANQVLDLLAMLNGEEFDRGGAMAASGTLQTEILETLDALPYYSMPLPKTLSYDFGRDIVYPLVENAGAGTADALRTYTEHIAVQVQRAVQMLRNREGQKSRLLITGGGGFNDFLTARIQALLQDEDMEIVVPEKSLLHYKEAITIALMGVLRWREENNVLAAITGARRNSIGGALWMGQDA
jgi:anhydro-N-acetylmuramic acid kinase